MGSVALPFYIHLSLVPLSNRFGCWCYLKLPRESWSMYGVDKHLFDLSHFPKENWDTSKWCHVHYHTEHQQEVSWCWFLEGPVHRLADSSSVCTTSRYQEPWGSSSPSDRGRHFSELGTGIYLQELICIPKVLNGFHWTLCTEFYKRKHWQELKHSLTWL